MHFDFKPTNILVKLALPQGSAPSQIDLKLCDLGLAGTSDCYTIGRKRWKNVQTWPYKAPEALMATAPLSYPTDMWTI